MPYPQRNRLLDGRSILASVPWVAQWKFNNDGNDSIISNTLTNNNSATFTTGLLGGATGATQVVAASSQYWSRADNAALSMGDVDFTIALWVYLDSFPVGDYAVILGKGVGWSIQLEYALYIRNSTNDFYFHVANGTASGSKAHSTLPSLSIWNLVVGWHDSVANTVNIQVNDGVVASASYSGGSYDSAGALQIGGHYNLGTKYVNGRIDNACIAKSAAGGGGVLTAAQRTAFYNAGVGTEAIR